MTKIISWNIARRREPWRHLLDMDADIALLQEAAEPPPEIAARVAIDPAPWRLVGADANPTRSWRTAIVKLSDRVHVEWIEAKPIEQGGSGEFVVSRPGALAAAKVTPPGGAPFIVISMYAVWESMHDSTGSRWIYADGSAHRMISDLAGFIGHATRHRILAAGDLNILRGHGEFGDAYAAARYATVFERMDALGLPFIGPQAPHGRQAEPWPDELPPDSGNVPTYHHSRQTPATATRQLDFVFASSALAESARVRAINEPEQWGPSDHCRVAIEIEETGKLKESGN